MSPPPTKWSDDEFLDSLRVRSDEPANRCARDLPRDDALAFLFTKMRTDAGLPPVADLPPAFASFLTEARGSLDFSDLTGAEMAKLKQGQRIFMTHALPMSLALLCKSLQEGYQAPRLGKVLMMSGELDSSTYRRVVGVLQMLIGVCTPGAFEPRLKSDMLPASDAAMMAVKIRLMHAGLRGIAKRKFPEFTRLYGGEPISMEDMLATLVGFSWLVVEGLRKLKIQLSADDEEAYYFVWAAFARAMGIHPPGQPKSWDCIPRTLAEATEFYASYQRRHYAEFADNPEGVQLALSNMRMLQRRMPPFAARIYMRHLMGPQASDALGIKPYVFPLLKLLYLNFPRAWVGFWNLIDRKRRDGGERHMEMSRFLLQDLVVLEYKDKLPSYRVPRDVTEIREVVTGTQPGLNFGRDQLMREVYPMEIADIAARRTALGQDTAPLFDSVGKARAPSADLGLTGLSLSGGGIRSATFALGAVQALARQGCLKMMDYLSTVSGGGYTGSALSSVLNEKDAALDGRAFPFDYETGRIEPPAVRHLRNGSNYLVGNGLLDRGRLPTVIIRGILLNAVLVAPYIMALTLLTWVTFPWFYGARLGSIFVIASFSLFSLLIFAYPVSRRFFRKNRSWRVRVRTENWLTESLFLLITAVAISLGSTMVFKAISADWFDATDALLAELRHPVEARDMWKWAIVALVGYAAVKLTNTGKVVRSTTGRLGLFLLGLTGPVLMFTTYIALLAIFVRSPFVPKARADGRTTMEVLNSSAALPGGRLTDSTLLHQLGVRGVGPGWDTTGANGSVTVQQLPLRESNRAERILDAFGADSMPQGREQQDLDRFMVQSWVLLDSIETHNVEHIPRVGPTGVVERIDTVASVDWQVYHDTLSAREIADYIYIHTNGFGAAGYEQDWSFLAAMLLLFGLNGFWIDVNLTSPHGFWRDRLSRVFLIKSRWFGKPEPNDEMKLSEMGTSNPAVPYHLINTSLNLTGSEVEDMPGRGSDFFVFSRRYCGSYSTGYAATADIEKADTHINLGTAFAISAAATAPNSGTVTIRPLVFMMALLNVRLDYWAPNPWYIQSSSRTRQYWVRWMAPGPWYLLREALGLLHARGAFVNLSDGGHIENLAIYELLRRRCKVIVCADAEEDPTMSCASLAKAIRYARIDLGIEIDINLDPLALDDTSGRTHRHWTIGKIKYGDHETGYLLYVKSSVTGDEAPYVNDYRKRNPAFPQEPTSDQFFDEAQFESYRALGYHAMNGALKSVMNVDTGDGSHGSEEAMKAIRDALGLHLKRSTGQVRAMESA